MHGKQASLLAVALAVVVFSAGFLAVDSGSNASVRAVIAAVASDGTSAPTAAPTQGVARNAGGTAIANGQLPTLPKGWPATLQIGISDEPGGAAMVAAGGFGLRYQYLAGGVNTGQGWTTWNPDGSFVTSYIQESVSNSIIPVFTYYQIRQSKPGSDQAEDKGVVGNLQKTETMKAYWNDLKLFFQKAGAFPQNMVVLHVEPDMWGYAEQASKARDQTHETIYSYPGLVRILKPRFRVQRSFGILPRPGGASARDQMDVYPDLEPTTHSGVPQAHGGRGKADQPGLIHFRRASSAHLLRRLEWHDGT